MMRLPVKFFYKICCFCYIHCMHTQDQERNSRLSRTGWVSVFSNLILAALKLLAGIFARSQALIADGVHSFSDLASDAVILAALRFSSKPADDKHPYGHGKFETMASVTIALLLSGVAVGILWNGIQGLSRVARGESLSVPGLLALGAALFSILVKEGLYRYARRVGEQEKSRATVANAWHHRSDALSSVATALGTGGAIVLGKEWALLDPAAAILVSLLIFRAAYHIARQDIDELLDVALSPEEQDQIVATVRGVEGVRNAHKLRTRSVGSSVSISLHIRVNGDMTVRAAHEIATEIEEKLRARYGEDSYLSVHVEPEKEQS